MVALEVDLLLMSHVLFLRRTLQSRSLSRQIRISEYVRICFDCRLVPGCFLLAESQFGVGMMFSDETSDFLA